MCALCSPLTLFVLLPCAALDLSLSAILNVFFCLFTHTLAPTLALLLCPVLNFYLDSRWGLHADRLVVSKEQRGARSIPGLSLLQAADRALTSCHLTSDLLVGDVAITQGRHYWACSVEPGSYLVKVQTFSIVSPARARHMFCLDNRERSLANIDIHLDL